MNRIYVFGDSITYGAWDSQGGWCDRIKRKLHALKIDRPEIKLQMFNLGIGGETSRALVKRFANELQTRHRPEWPAVVVLATGANDTRYTTTEQEPAVPEAEFRANLTKLIDLAREYTAQILLVGLAPVQNDPQPFKDTLFSNALLQKYDDSLTEITREQTLPKVELFAAFQAADTNLHSSDGVHPSDLGHEVIERLVWEKLRGVVGIRI
jgi:lysophospholipase L1-like esterase